MGESYSCASGGLIAAGRYVAPNISGVTWTPVRDGSGNVLAGNWIGLPLNSWVEAAGQVLNDVIQTPHYTNSSSGDSASGIINAWGGMAWDYTNQIGYITGGGHGDSSACETGIYAINAAKMQFSRVRDRDPMSQLQCWNSTTHAFQAAELWTAGYNSPLVNGVPGSTHTYHGLIWIPPSVLGNTKGGVLPFGTANSIYNLDTGAWTTTNWFSPEALYFDLSNCAAFIDGSKVYGPHSSWYHWRYDLTQTQETSWHAASFGKFETTQINSSVNINVGGAIWGQLRERREEFSFSSAGFHRVKYGQAIDSSATDWSAYGETITLTSTDGSHADFTNAALADDALMAASGVVYDHATQTIYIQPNNTGSQLYKLTGLSGTTWTTEKIAGTGCTRAPVRCTYGRLRLATLGGKKVLLRITNKDHPVQVMRIS